MPVQFQGAKELSDMATQLRKLSMDFQRTDQETMAHELEALKPAVRRSATTALPHRGGLNKLVAASDLKVMRGGPAVTLRATNKSNIRTMNDQGTWRHPVFGKSNKTRNEWRWVTQSNPRVRGWYDNPTLSSEMRLRRAVDRNRQRILDRVR